LKYSTFGAVAALSIAFAPAAYASTVTASFTKDFVATGSLSGGRSLASLDFDASIAGVINFSADVDAGTFTSTSSATQRFTFDDEFTLAEAQTATFTHKVTSLSTGYSTRFGASATATADIVIAEIDIIDEGALVTTSASDTTLDFGQTLQDTDRDDLVGTGIGLPVGLSPVIDATVNLEQRSRQRVTGVSGVLQARNLTTGTTLIQSYDSDDFGAESFNLNLAEVGIWDIRSISSDMFGTFEADFGTSATGTVGGFFGFDCGDVSTDDDNGFFCISDFGASVTTPAAYVVDNSPFAMDYQTADRSIFLGQITVKDDPIIDEPNVVPLPAGAWLLLSGLGLMAAARRRSA